MKVLGIETATFVCGAAVAEGGRILSETSLRIRNAHAESLLGQIAGVLRDAKTSAAVLGGVAVSIGPGSFTGLRIGLSVAKGLIYPRGIPLVGVPTLEALAHHTVSIEKPGPGEYVLAALDARRDEVYCQLFEYHDAALSPVGEARDITVGALRSELEGRRVLVTGDGAGKIVDAAPHAGQTRRASDPASLCSAASVALIGERMILAGMTDDPATMEPRYIKEFFHRVR